VFSPQTPRLNYFVWPELVWHLVALIEEHCASGVAVPMATVDHLEQRRLAKST
jgi:hypothetical protein